MSSVYLKNISISNVGPIDDLSFDFTLDGNVSLLNLIVSSNGLGKSSLLKTIALTEPFWDIRIDSYDKLKELEALINNRSTNIPIDQFRELSSAFSNANYWNISLITDWVANSIRNKKITIKAKYEISIKERVIDLNLTSSIELKNKMEGTNNERPHKNQVSSIELNENFDYSFYPLDHAYVSSDSYGDFLHAESSIFLAFGPQRLKCEEKFDSDSILDYSLSLFNGNTIYSPDAIYTTSLSYRSQTEDHDHLGDLSLLNNMINLVNKEIINSQFMEIDSIEYKSVFDGRIINNLVYTCNSHQILFKQLSSGYQSALVLLYNIVFNMFLRNRKHMLGYTLENIFSQSMIILIDEIDIHYHPKWQLDFIKFMRGLFPRTQFILTCHSPLAVLHAEDAHVHVISKYDSGITEVTQFHTSKDNYSLDDIVAKVFHMNPLSPKTLNELNKFIEFSRNYTA